MSPTARPEAHQVAVVAAFAASRVVFRALGVRYDAEPLAVASHFVDPALLRDDPWRSLLYLHAQPPLMSAGLAAALALRPGDPGLVFELVYAALGLALALALLALLRALGLAPWVAAVAAALYVVSPSAILYESWAFDAHLVAALLCVSGVLVHRYLARPTLSRATQLYAVLAMLALTRNVFHLFWMLASTVLFLLVLRTRWRTTVLGAALPTSVVAAWYAKNLILFGVFTSSSWFGMNVARTSVQELVQADRPAAEAMVRAGKLSPFALIPPFSGLDAYGADAPGHTGVPLLDMRRESNGLVNYHHIAYIAISNQYLRDSVYVLLHRPDAYVRGQTKAWLIYFFPTSDYFALWPNRDRIDLWDRAWGLVLLGQPDSLNQPRLVPGSTAAQRNVVAYYLEKVGWLVVAAHVVAAAYALKVIRAGRESCAGRPARRGLAVWLLTTLVYVALASNLLETGDNNRFRYPTEPYLFVLVTATAAGLMQRRNSLRQPVPA